MAGNISAREQAKYSWPPPPHEHHPSGPGTGAMGPPDASDPRRQDETQCRPRSFSTKGSSESIPSGAKGVRWSATADASLSRPAADEYREEVLRYARTEESTPVQEESVRFNASYMPTIREDLSMSPANASPAPSRAAKHEAASSPQTTPLRPRGGVVSFRSPRTEPAKSPLEKHRRIVSFSPAKAASGRTRKSGAERQHWAKDSTRGGDHDWEDGQLTPNAAHALKDSVQILDRGGGEEEWWVDEDGSYYFWGERRGGDVKRKGGKPESTKEGAAGVDPGKQHVPISEEGWDPNYVGRDDQGRDKQAEENEPRKASRRSSRRVADCSSEGAIGCGEAGRDHSAEGDARSRKRNRKEKDTESRKVRRSRSSERDETCWEGRGESPPAASKAAHENRGTQKIKGAPSESVLYEEIDIVGGADGPLQGTKGRHVRDRRSAEMLQLDRQRVAAEPVLRHPLPRSSHVDSQNDGYKRSAERMGHPSMHASEGQGHVAQGHAPPSRGPMAPIRKYENLDWPPGWDRPAHMQPAPQKGATLEPEGAAAKMNLQTRSKKPSKRDPRRRKALCASEDQGLESHPVPHETRSAARGVLDNHMGPDEGAYRDGHRAGVREPQRSRSETGKTSQRTVQPWGGCAEEGEFVEHPEARRDQLPTPGYLSAFLCPCSDGGNEAHGCGQHGLQGHGAPATKIHRTATAMPLQQISEAGGINEGPSGGVGADNKTAPPRRRRPQWPDVVRRSEDKENSASAGHQQGAVGQGTSKGPLPQAEQPEPHWVSVRTQQRERELQRLQYVGSRGSDAPTGTIPGEGHQALIHEWPVSQKSQAPKGPGAKRWEEEAGELKRQNWVYGNETNAGQTTDYQGRGKAALNGGHEGGGFEARGGYMAMRNPQGSRERQGGWESEEDEAGAKLQQRSESKAWGAEERKLRRQRSASLDSREEWETDGGTRGRGQRTGTERTRQEREKGRGQQSDNHGMRGPLVSSGSGHKGRWQDRDGGQWGKGGTAAAQRQGLKGEGRPSSCELAQHWRCGDASKDSELADRYGTPQVDQDSLTGQGSGHLVKEVQGERSLSAPPRVHNDGVQKELPQSAAAGNNGTDAEPKQTEGGAAQGGQQGAGAGSTRKRRTRWEDGGESAPPPLGACGDVAAMLAAVQLPDFVRALGGGLVMSPELQTLYAQLSEINKLLRSNATLVSKDLPARERSPSPEPVYDNMGMRTNTREVRAREKLNKQRHDVITRIIKLDPTFKPPSDYRPPRHFRKLFVPVQDYPGYNFVGLILGPRGNTQKRMEKETGTKITIRGKGSQKEGKEALVLRGAPRDAYRGVSEDSEALHVLIEADNETSLEEAAARVQALLSPTHAQHNEHKQRQLKELAEINGTTREPSVCHQCGAAGHRQYQCPEKAKGFHAGVTCSTCGNVGHPTRDCPVALKAGEQGTGTAGKGEGAKLEEEYVSFLEEVGATGPERAPSTFHGASIPRPKAEGLPGAGAAQGRPGLGYPPPGGGVLGQQGRRAVFRDEECNIFVSCIPYSIDDVRLQELFAPFGYVQEAKVIKDRVTGKSRGFGFVLFADKDSAALAIKCMDGFHVENKCLAVKPSQKGGASAQDPNAASKEQNSQGHMNQHGGLTGPGVYRGPVGTGAPAAYPYPAPWPVAPYPAYYQPYGVPCDPYGYPAQCPPVDPSYAAYYGQDFAAPYGGAYGEDVTEEAPPGADPEAPPGLEVGESGACPGDMAPGAAMADAAFCPSLPMTLDSSLAEFPECQSLGAFVQCTADAFAGAGAAMLTVQTGEHPSEVHAETLVPHSNSKAMEHIPGCEPNVSLESDAPRTFAMPDSAPGLPGPTEALGSGGAADMECSKP